MARYVTTMDVAAPPDEAFAYLADFTNATEWDPSTQEATRIDERAYRLVVRFAGRSVPLRYQVAAVDPPRRITFDVTGDRVRGRDDISVEPLGAGSRVRYDAEVRIIGVLGRLAEPLLALAFRKAAGAAADGIRDRLAR